MTSRIVDTVKLQEAILKRVTSLTDACRGGKTR